MNSSLAQTPTSVSHQTLLEAAILAPTPDNNQPWRFVSHEDAFYVCLDSTRALPSDVHGMFDLVGLGAAIENASLAAGEAGCQLRLALDPRELPPPADPTIRPIAAIRIKPGGSPDPLYRYISHRCTNRKPYCRQALPADTLLRLAGTISGYPEVQLDWVASRRDIRRIAWLVAAGDRFRFQYQPFHKEIYRQLRFTAQEAAETGDGLDIRTLELPPGAATLLRFLRSWRRMVWVRRLGLLPLLTIPSLVSVIRSGAIGVLSVPAPATENYLTAGRAFERIWLAATAEGLALQPLGSLPIFLAQWEQLAGQNLSPADQRLAQRIPRRLETIVPRLAGRTLLMLFRVGYAPSPSARSLRRPLTAVLDVSSAQPSTVGDPKDLLSPARRSVV